ncbi:MAG: DUF4198 domain-containing protein [Verrucomicrobiota bacterium]|nr:DUF4198 domain-containing protein [Verrucomicrobiota bacterium]
MEGDLPMMLTDATSTTLALLLILSICAALCAHDLVLVAQSDDAFLIKWGDSGEYEPADLHRLVGLDAFALGRKPGISLLDAKLNGTKPDWLVRELKRLVGCERVPLVTAQYDNGYWEESADGGEINTDKLGFAGAKNAGHYFKSGKGLTLAGRAEFKRISGQRLEIVPQADSFTFKPNGALEVQVLRRGKPLADAEWKSPMARRMGKMPRNIRPVRTESRRCRFA